jgi:hypothetical protein
MAMGLRDGVVRSHLSVHVLTYSPTYYDNNFCIYSSRITIYLTLLRVLVQRLQGYTPPTW